MLTQSGIPLDFWRESGFKTPRQEWGCLRIGSEHSMDNIYAPAEAIRDSPE